MNYCNHCGAKLIIRTMEQYAAYPYDPETGAVLKCKVCPKFNNVFASELHQAPIQFEKNEQ